MMITILEVTIGKKMFRITYNIYSLKMKERLMLSRIKIELLMALSLCSYVESILTENFLKDKVLFFPEGGKNPLFEIRSNRDIFTMRHCMKV